VREGLNVIKEKIARDGKYVSKAGKVRQEARLAWCRARQDRSGAARTRIGIGKVAREIGLGVDTVHRLKRKIAAHAPLGRTTAKRHGPAAGRPETATWLPYQPGENGENSGPTGPAA
jgi:hypothetical protein